MYFSNSVNNKNNIDTSNSQVPFPLEGNMREG